MDDFIRRPVNAMLALWDQLILRRVEPVKFVRDQWSLVDLLKNRNIEFWEDYRSIVNRIEISIAIAADENRSLSDEDFETFEAEAIRAKQALESLLNGH